MRAPRYDGDPLQPRALHGQLSIVDRTPLRHHAVEQRADLQALGALAARYDELLIHHPAAFSDQAAAFLLTDNPRCETDSRRALELAQMNLRIRPTPRSRELVGRAIAAMGEHR